MKHLTRVSVVVVSLSLLAAAPAAAQPAANSSDRATSLRLADSELSLTGPRTMLSVGLSLAGISTFYGAALVGVSNIMCFDAEDSCDGSRVRAGGGVLLAAAAGFVAMTVVGLVRLRQRKQARRELLARMVAGRLSLEDSVLVRF